MAGGTPEEPPLLSYAALMGIFNLLLGVALVVARRTGRPLPERVGAADLLSIGVASHKVSRLLAKDKVTRPLRAPFTELEGEAGLPSWRRARAGPAPVRRSESSSSARIASAPGSRPASRSACSSRRA